MTGTGPQLMTESVVAAVKAVAADCDAPTLVTLLSAGGAVTGRRDAVPGGPTADNIAAALVGLSRVVAHHRSLFDPDIAGYAVILPGEQVAFAADRTGTTHHIQLPGVPTEQPRRNRWDALIDAVTALTAAATR